MLQALALTGAPLLPSLKVGGTRSCRESGVKDDATGARAQLVRFSNHGRPRGIRHRLRTGPRGRCRGTQDLRPRRLPAVGARLHRSRRQRGRRLGAGVRRDRPRRHRHAGRVRGRVHDPRGQLRVQGRGERQLGRVLRPERRRQRHSVDRRGRHARARRVRRQPQARRPRGDGPPRRVRGGIRRRPRGRPRAPARQRRGVLLRDDRPLRERRHVERPRRPRRRRPHHRLRPHPQGLLQRRRPRRPALAARLHRGARHDGDLAHAELQEPTRAGRRRERERRLPRLLGHGLHPDRPPPRHERRARRRSSTTRTPEASTSTSTSSRTTRPTSSTTRRASTPTSTRRPRPTATPTATRSTSASTPAPTPSRSRPSMRRRASRTRRR